MEELIVPLLYIAIPAIILMLAFVAFLRKEEEEVTEDRIEEDQSLRGGGRRHRDPLRDAQEAEQP